MFHEDFQGQSLYFQSSGYIHMEVFQGGFLHCIHAAGGNLIHQTAMLPTTPTITSSIPVLNSWKIWIAPSCAISLIPLMNCLRFIVFT